MWVLAELFILLVTLLLLRTVNHQDIGTLNKLYFSENNSHMNSKAWFDVCSIGHFKVGMGLQKVLSLLPLSENVRHIMMFVIVCLYEIIENNESRISAWVVKTYTGDSMINSFTDIGCAVAGYYTCTFIPWIPFLVLFPVLLFTFKCSPQVGKKIVKSIVGNF